MMKYQIPSAKLQTAVVLVWNLELGICLEFGIWNLVIEE